ncbi:MAG TPA: M48 family metallopeptidase, partial [Rhodothermales bacterium]
MLVIEGCICGDGVNAGDVNIIALDQEWELGRELADAIRQQAPVIDDVLVQEYVTRMGSRIVEVTERNDVPWTFHLVADTSINAFNIPGGHVFVNTGLIAAAETPDELAGVLSHEIAHGVARHATEQMTEAYGLNLLARLILGGDVGLLEQIAAQLVGTGTMAKFSRDDERESDRLGLSFMSDAGYDPNAMATMFERMLAIRVRRPSMLEQFFSTHPLTEERIDDVS